MSRVTNTELRGPRALDLLRDFPAWLLNDVPESRPRGAYLSLLVIVAMLGLSMGLFIWFLISLVWWIAVPLGAVATILGFLAVVALVGRIVPKKLPTDREIV